MTRQHELRTVIVATTLALDGPTGVNRYMKCIIDAWRAVPVRCGFASPWSPTGFYRIMRGIHRKSWKVLPVKTSLNHGHLLWKWLIKRSVLNEIAQVRKSGAKEIVIYAQGPLALVAASHAAPKDHGIRLAMVCHFNDSEKWEHETKFGPSQIGTYGKILDNTESEAFRIADVVVVPTGWLAKVLKSRHAQFKDKIVFVPYGIPDLPFEQVAEEQKSWDLIAIGTLEPRKNQGYLLDIAAECRKRGRPIKIAIVGDGPDRLALTLRAKDLGVAEDVEFLGIVAQSWRLTPKARFFIHVALLENQGLALIEAIAAGVPVIAVPVGGVPDVAIDDLSGMHIPANDVAAATTIIMTGLNDSSKRARLSLQAREHYLSTFHLKASMKRLDAVLWPASIESDS